MLASILVLLLVSFASAKVGYVEPSVPMLDGRIVGGRPTTIGEYPHQLSLQRGSSHICGASIINQKVALTAAHCTYGQVASILRLRAGSTYHSLGGSLHPVHRICQHPRYNPVTVDYDISVLVVQTPFTYGPSIQPIKLVTSKPAVGSLATVTGWGKLCTDCGIPSNLQKVSVPVISTELCRRQYGYAAITDRMFCCGYITGGKDSCQGDSGGPLIYNGQQIGVVSWGTGCAEPNKAGIYANVITTDAQQYVDKCVTFTD